MANPKRTIRESHIIMACEVLPASVVLDKDTGRLMVYMVEQLRRKCTVERFNEDRALQKGTLVATYDPWVNTYYTIPMLAISSIRIVDGAEGITNLRLDDKDVECGPDVSVVPEESNPLSLLLARYGLPAPPKPFICPSQFRDIVKITNLPRDTQIEVLGYNIRYFQITDTRHGAAGWVY